MWSCSAWRAFMRLLIAVWILSRLLMSIFALFGADFARLHQFESEWFFWKQWEWCFVRLRGGVLLCWALRRDEFNSQWIIAPISRHDVTEFEWCEWHVNSCECQSSDIWDNGAKKCSAQNSVTRCCFPYSPSSYVLGLKARGNLKDSASWTLPVSLILSRRNSVCWFVWLAGWCCPINTKVQHFLLNFSLSGVFSRFCKTFSTKSSSSSPCWDSVFIYTILKLS